MGRILSKEVFDTITTPELRALPDLWDAALKTTDAQQIGALESEYLQNSAGNGAAVVQQLTALIDNGSVGWAPWQRQGVLAMASLPTDKLMSGKVLADYLVAQGLKMASAILTENSEMLTKAAEEILGPIVKIVTSIPLIGQIINVVLGFVLALVDMIQGHAAANAAAVAASIEAGRPYPASPFPAGDRALLNSYVKSISQSGDWTPLFMPYLSPDFCDGWRNYRSYGSQNCQDGWLCVYLKREVTSPYAGGVLIVPGGSRSEGVSQDLGVGLGMIPGGDYNIHRGIQASPSGKQASGQARHSDTVDTGDWLTMTRSAAIHMWSLLWSDAQSSLAVDPYLAATSWQAYIDSFLSHLDNGRICKPRSHQAATPGIRSATRNAIRVRFCRTIGVPSSSSPEEAASSFPGLGLFADLARHQDFILKSTAVAYIDPDSAPPGLRVRIVAARKSLLESPLVCRLDYEMIPDTAYRSQVFSRQELSGMKCSVGGVSLQAPLGGGETFDLRVERVVVPEGAIPRVPRAGSSAARKQLTGRASAASKATERPSWVTTYGLQAAAASTLLAVGGFALHRQRKGRKS